MKKIVAIVDYGLGNILSAKQSFIKVISDNNIDAEVKITNNPKDVESSTHIVLPGQGAFKSCMNNLSKISGMISTLEDKVIKNKNLFLGICIGMQLLADKSFENGEHKGLGWIKGEIKKIPYNNLKLPHMCWNEVKIVKKNPLVEMQEMNDYYFVHSYYFECFDSKNIIGTSNYGLEFTSFISKENIYGVQFHPEKSSKQGLNIIKNFLLQ
tara:strand:- start:1483 stop:2115 length:633 start_codon:yes stop_codon:yes gene_type:complete